jgi:hypothetical protein
MQAVRTAVLKFNDTDYHNLIDLLVEAVKVTEATGHRPSVVVEGRTYAPYALRPLTNSRPLSGAPMRRFPRPWSVESTDGGFKVVDANKQAIAYVYGRETKDDADIAHVLTMDEARRIASNIAKLPTLLEADKRND